MDWLPIAFYSVMSVSLIVSAIAVWVVLGEKRT